MYAKIDEAGKLLIYRKRHVVIDGTLTVNPTAQTMAKVGYKPLVTAAAPALAEGETLCIDYVDAGDRIESVYSIIRG